MTFYTMLCYVHTVVYAAIFCDGKQGHSVPVPLLTVTYQKNILNLELLEKWILLVVDSNSTITV